MARHYTEDELTLYYYGEGRGRTRIDAHLSSCATCATAYRELSDTLALIGAPDAPERGDQYGLEVWQRIRYRLPDSDAGWRAWLGGQRLVLAGSAAALVVAAFAVGRLWPGPPAPSSPLAATPARTPGAGVPAEARERILLATVADHLDRSARVLTDIMNAPEPGDISAEQRWAEDLLTANRLYRQDAADAGERPVASVLDELERSLLEIVHSPSRVSAAELEQIRRRIDAAALLFKVQVMSEELRRQEGPPATGRPLRTSTRTIG